MTTPPPLDPTPLPEIESRDAQTLAAAGIEDTAELPELQLPYVAVPEDQAGIDVLRLEIDAVDAELVRLILQRTALSGAIGVARKSLGGPRIVFSREMAIFDRFRDLGPAGAELGMMLLAMGRGRLGRK